MECEGLCFILRGEKTGNGLMTEPGVFNNAGFAYFDKERRAFPVRYDERPCEAFPLEMWYLEVNEFLGGHRFIAPFDMYEAFMETNADVREE